MTTLHKTPTLRGKTLLRIHSMLIFPENEGDSRKIKKAEKIIQHFSEQCRHYVLKQNI